MGNTCDRTSTNHSEEIFMFSFDMPNRGIKSFEYVTSNDICDVKLLNNKPSMSYKEQWSRKFYVRHNQS